MFYVYVVQKVDNILRKILKVEIIKETQKYFYTGKAISLIDGSMQSCNYKLSKTFDYDAFYKVFITEVEALNYALDYTKGQIAWFQSQLNNSITLKQEIENYRSKNSSNNG